MAGIVNAGCCEIGGGVCSSDGFRSNAYVFSRKTMGNDCRTPNFTAVRNTISLYSAVQGFIHTFPEEHEEIISNPKTLKADFSVFEATNKRTKNFDLLFDTLKTIQYSSVASERVFSISGNFVSKSEHD